MSLFGAATSGVDPQTGSYLSKEQRVAMFRASQGRGGTGGSASGGVGSGARVSPQNSIVVVNKLNKISENLQSNFTSATANVAEQVAKNRKDIEDLYTYVNKRQENLLTTEKAETKEDRLAYQNMRFNMREKIVEGLSSTLAKAAEAGKKVATTVAQPMMGFLERLKNALLLLAGAWLVKNLPSILDDIELAFENFDDVKRELGRQLLNQRGWAAGIETFLRSVMKGARGVGKSLWSFTRWIGGKTFSVIGKVFTSVKNFLTNVVSGIVQKLTSIWGSLVSKIKSVIPKGVKDGVKNIVKSPPARAVGGFLNRTKNYITGVGKNLMQGKFSEAGSRAFSPFKKGFEGLKNFATKTAAAPIEKYAQEKGVKELTPQARTKGLNKMFEPIISALGISKKAAAGILGKAAKLPVMGIIVDIALNKAGGMDWMNSIINGLATGLAGAVGWKAGGAAGAAVGTAIFPGVGTAIGGVLGAFGGSMIAASLAEGGLNKVREAVGVEPTVRPEVSQETMNQLGNLPGLGFLKESSESLSRGLSPDQESRTPKINASLSSQFEGGASTPAGLSAPDGGASSVYFDQIELPPIQTRIPKSNGESPATPNTQEPPALAASDNLMDAYRNYALIQYQLN